MRLPLVHPRRRALVAFALGESAGRTRVARHLERCSECRQLVGFTQRLEKSASALPPAVANDSILQRALESRAAGARIILPVAPQGRTRRSGRVAALMSAAAAIVVLAAWLATRPRANDFRSVNELLVAGLLPKDAEASQATTRDALVHKLRPMTFSFERRFVDASGRATDGGRLDATIARGPQAGTWRITSLWSGLSGSPDRQGAHEWRESAMVRDGTLEPITRTVTVTPFRRWDGIHIAQSFRNDSVLGEMTLMGTITHRPIQHDLRPARAPIVVAEALAPIYFLGLDVQPRAVFNVDMLGWAVVDNDVLAPVSFRVDGSEKIATPAGSFDCWRLTLQTKGPSVANWIRKSDHFAVLTRRVQSDGTIRETVLTREGTPP
jgi:hypothetical protein